MLPHLKHKFRIHDFAGYSDTRILWISVAVSILITVAIVGIEIAWKFAFAQNLVPLSHTWVFMGMKVVSFVKPIETSQLSEIAGALYLSYHSKTCRSAPMSLYVLNTIFHTCTIFSKTITQKMHKLQATLTNSARLSFSRPT